MPKSKQRDAAMVQHQREVNERLLTMAIRQLRQHLTLHGQTEAQANQTIRAIFESEMGKQGQADEE